MESELPESRDNSRKTQSGKHSGDGDKIPAGCDSRHEISRRPPQSASEAAPADCGRRYLPPLFFLLSIRIWPLSERWFGKGNTRPTYRKPLLHQRAQIGTRLRRAPAK